MDTSRVLYFLSVLDRETRGHEDDIAQLYNRAIDENGDVIRLKHLINEHVFYHEIGKDLCEQGRSILNQLNATPSSALELLPQLRQASDAIDNEVAVCTSLMLSPEPFSEMITVLKKKDIIAYLESFRMIASTCVYLILLYSGLQSTKELSWNDNVGIQEMLNSINSSFLPALCKTKRPSYSWVIWKKRMGGKALFGGDCFYLAYESTKRVETLCNYLHKEAIGTHAFLNIDAYESGELNVPFCWGVGNIISITPADALQSLNRKFVTKVRAPNRQELNRKMPTPFECVKQLSDGQLFCISPDELLLSMNRWHLGNQIEKKKLFHNCLFCGKHVDGSQLVCPSHFSTEL